MKKLTLVLLVLGVCVVPAVAKATPIPIGSIAYDVAEGGHVFTIYNLTGDGGFSTTYPIPTGLWWFNPRISYYAPDAEGTMSVTALGPDGSHVTRWAPEHLSWARFTFQVGPDTGAYSTPFEILYDNTRWLVERPDVTATVVPGVDEGFAVLNLEGTAIEVVPEPATLMLLGTGLVVGLRARRRR